MASASTRPYAKLACPANWRGKHSHVVLVRGEVARMANFAAIYSVGNSIAQYLQNAYPPTLATSFACQFKLVSSTEIATEDQTALDQVVSIFLHRITINENFRGVTRLQDAPTKQPAAFLDLHYLLTYWGTSAQAEQTILGWTLQQ